MWKIDAYKGMLLSEIEEHVLMKNKLKWVNNEELEQYAFPVPHQKIFASLTRKAESCS